MAFFFNQVDHSKWNKQAGFFWKHKLFFKSEVKPADFSTIESKFSKSKKMRIKSRGASSSRWEKIRVSWILSVSAKSMVHSWKFSTFHKLLPQKIITLVLCPYHLDYSKGNDYFIT